MQSTDLSTLTGVPSLAPPSSLWRDTLRSVLGNRWARIGRVVVGVLLQVDLMTPVLAPS